MRRWFSRLPIHQKLVVTALAVSTAALAVASLGLLLIDIWLFRATARDEVASLARLIAENTAAAVSFDDVEAARANLDSVGERPNVRRVCLYGADGTLFAGVSKPSVTPCGPARPTDVDSFVVIGVSAVRWNDRELGSVYVERDLSDIGPRVLAFGATLLGLVILGAGVAMMVAHRIHRTISSPIAQLASAARDFDPNIERGAMAAVHVSEDEVGELVRAFGEMEQRVRESSRRLIDSNTALQTEVDTRRRMQAEREVLLEREREASRLKDEFLAAVSHELRTPLNAILGWLQVLSTAPPSEQTMAKALASVRRNAHAQNRVIEDLLDVSRIITGKLQLQLAAIDLRAVIESALETMVPTAIAKSIHIDSSVPSVACIVQGDYDRLRQIAWNLLSNAVKFTPPGGAIQLRLVATRDNFVLSVTDTGIGISAPFLPYAFDRFRQADGSTTRQFGGLGLGLAIVKELTDLHGGTVDVRSDGEGKGSTFILTLPRFMDRPSIDVTGATVDPLPRLDGVQVLAVDDNLDALDVAAAALSEVGAHVRQALCADDAITLWQLAPSDVVLCDLAMPSADGFELLRRLRRTDAAGERVPAIAVTAYASEHYRQSCLDAGFQAHVAKPYDTVELIKTVALAVERNSP